MNAKMSRQFFIENFPIKLTDHEIIIAKTSWNEGYMSAIQEFTNNLKGATNAKVQKLPITEQEEQTKTDEFS